MKELLFYHNLDFVTPVSEKDIVIVDTMRSTGHTTYIYKIADVFYTMTIFKQEKTGYVWDHHSDCLTDIARVRGSDFVEHFYGVKIPNEAEENPYEPHTFRYWDWESKHGHIGACV